MGFAAPAAPEALSDESVLALIPARGGSKGIPRKNLLDVAGKPLIAWSILTSVAASRIDRVVVSTDDDEIASVARHWGAEVPFMRPAAFSQDHSPDIEVFRHALEYLAEAEAYRPAMVVHLRPTAPVRRVEDVDAAIGLLASRPDADAVRSVSLARQTPYKMWRLTEDGAIAPFATMPGQVDCQSGPRQLLPRVYAQNGYVDVVRPRAVLEMHSMWGHVVLPFMIDVLFDLDYPEDVAPVEGALRRLERGLELPHVGSDRHSV